MAANKNKVWKIRILSLNEQLYTITRKVVSSSVLMVNAIYSAFKTNNMQFSACLSAVQGMMDWNKLRTSSRASGRFFSNDLVI